jgi:hypothetical protein
LGTQRIVAIDRNQAKKKGAESKTLLYKYYNNKDHMSPPTNADDYNYITYAERLCDPITCTTAAAAEGWIVGA